MSLAVQTSKNKLMVSIQNKFAEQTELFHAYFLEKDHLPQRSPDGFGQRQKISPSVLLPGDKGSLRQTISVLYERSFEMWLHDKQSLCCYLSQDLCF